MKKITIDAFLAYKFLSEPAISPDGKFTAFIVHTPDLEGNGYVGSIHLYCHATGEQKKLTTIGTVKGFTWLNEKTILFPSTRCPKTREKLAAGEELTVYYTISVDGGEAQEAVALDLLAGKATKLGGGKYLISANYDNNRPNLEGLSKAERLEVLKEYKNAGYTIFEEVPFWGNNQGVINRKRNRLYIYDINTGKAEPITAPLFNVTGAKADETHIIYMGGEYSDVRPVYAGLYVYTIATGETVCLSAPESFNIRAVELYGEDKAVVVGSDAKDYGLNQNGDIYTVDLKTGEKTLVMKHGHLNVGGNTTGSDCRYGGGKSTAVVGDIFYYITTVVNHSYLYTLNLKTGETGCLTTEGTVDSFDIKGDKIVMVSFKGNQIGELYSVEKGVEEKLTGFNDFVLEEYSVSTPEALTCVNREGMEIYGYVMKPIGYVAGNKYPAILNIHGGPRTVFSSIYFHEMQMWANEGYFVIFCNPRGGDGRGNDFADIRAKYGTIDYEDLMDFTDTALATYDDIDSDRVGVTGGSYGGFMTNWIIGHTHRFKAACAQRSIANWTSFEGTTDIGYYFGPDQTGASHTNNQPLQWQQSPLKYADQAVTPTLFIHADEDYRCWMVEGLQMFTALKMHGVPSRMCLLKGENHELSRSGKPQNRIKRMEEITVWMNNYLK